MQSQWHTAIHMYFLLRHLWVGCGSADLGWPQQGLVPGCGLGPRKLFILLGSAGKWGVFMWNGIRMHNAEICYFSIRVIENEQTQEEFSASTYSAQKQA